jgi:hypothetical protein
MNKFSQNDTDRKAKTNFVELTVANSKAADGAREYQAAFKANQNK